jgi:hypothetical protein
MENANLNPAQMEQIKPPHFLPIPYKAEGSSENHTGFSKIVSISGRHHVVANIRGHRVPFYLSTGLGGKQNVEAGKWYPHFGIGKDGWINKGPEEAMAQHYSPHLKKVSEWLNRSVGNTAEGHISLFGGDSSGVPVTAEKGPHIDAINEGLSPVSQNESAWPNAKSVLERVHTSPTMMSKEDTQKDWEAHTLLEKHAKENPNLNLGVHLP